MAGGFQNNKKRYKFKYMILYNNMKQIAINNDFEKRPKNFVQTDLA